MRILVFEGIVYVLELFGFIKNLVGRLNDGWFVVRMLV